MLFYPPAFPIRIWWRLRFSGIGVDAIIYQIVFWFWCFILSRQLSKFYFILFDLFNQLSNFYLVPNDSIIQLSSLIWVCCNVLGNIGKVCPIRYFAHPRGYLLILAICGTGSLGEARRGLFMSALLLTQLSCLLLRSPAYCARLFTQLSCLLSSLLIALSYLLSAPAYCALLLIALSCSFIFKSIYMIPSLHSHLCLLQSNPLYDDFERMALHEVLSCRRCVFT